MNKIIIYGIGNRCGMWQDWFKREYHVIGFVSENDEEKITSIKGIQIIKKEEICDIDYEAIVILTDRKSWNIYEKVTEYARDKKDVYWLDEFLEVEDKQGNYEESCLGKQKEILREIINAPDEVIRDYRWLYKRVVQYGLYCFRRQWLETDEDINWSFCGIQQIPEEFAKYCILLSDLKISSAIDIGVYNGRSSYFICAILMRKNPHLSYTLVDLVNRLDHFDDFHEILPGICKVIPGSSNDYSDVKFDYVFIDADHTYAGSMEDYKNVGKNANVIVAFHDIFAHEYDCYDGGTVRTWNEVMKIEADSRCVTFAKYPNKWMGIGCVLKGAKR